MAIFRREPSPSHTLTGTSIAGGVGRNRDSEPISGSLRVVNRSSGKCNTLSCDGPWRVYDTSRRYAAEFLMAEDNDEVYDKKP